MTNNERTSEARTMSNDDLFFAVAMKYGAAYDFEFCDRVVLSVFKYLRRKGSSDTTFNASHAYMRCRTLEEYAETMPTDSFDDVYGYRSEAWIALDSERKLAASNGRLLDLTPDRDKALKYTLYKYGNKYFTTGDEQHAVEVTSYGRIWAHVASAIYRDKGLKTDAWRSCVHFTDIGIESAADLEAFLYSRSSAKRFEDAFENADLHSEDTERIFEQSFEGHKLSNLQIEVIKLKLENNNLSETAIADGVTSHGLATSKNSVKSALRCVRKKYESDLDAYHKAHDTTTEAWEAKLKKYKELKKANKSE